MSVGIRAWLGAAMALLMFAGACGEVEGGILIDFEGQSLSQGDSVPTLSGVSFSNARVAEYGGSGPGDAFLTSLATLLHDVGNAGPFDEVGNTFIVATGPNQKDTIQMNFTSYLDGVNGLSFRLADIDETEVFTATAFDENMNVLQTVILSDPANDVGTGNAEVADISFGVGGIYHVHAAVTNSTTAFAGFGIDDIRFSDNSTVPEPTSLAVFGLLGLTGIATRRRRR